MNILIKLSFSLKIACFLPRIFLSWSAESAEINKNFNDATSFQLIYDWFLIIPEESFWYFFLQKIFLSTKW